MLRTIDGPGPVVGGAWIERAEVYADGVQVFWKDTSPPDRSRRIEVGERDHPHFMDVSYDVDAPLGQGGAGGSSGSVLNGARVEMGHRLTSPAPPARATQLRLSDGTRCLTLQLQPST